MNFKKAFQNFRAWQRDPFNYKNHSGGQTWHCRNCGTDFADNFCPRCGQKWGVGRVGWDTVRKDILLIWGMDTRSLCYTLVQLLLRPGYLISDYISGRRQVSFPPVKMLLIVALAYMLVCYLTGSADAETTTDTATQSYIFKAYDNWYKQNPGWGTLASHCIMLLPVWFIFRHAPRHTRIMIPECFLIMVFLSTLALFITTLSKITFEKLPIITLFYYVITFRQLFHYGWWGTIWRTLFVFFEGFVILLTIPFIIDVPWRGTPANPQYTLAEEMLSICVFHALNLIPLTIVCLINRWTEKRRKRKEKPSESITPAA